MSREDSAARSQAGEAYRLVRTAIVEGTFPPGARLSPAELAQRYGLGGTPVREALARLAAENLAVAIEQRGFRVAPLSGAELRELLELRKDFELRALIASMNQGGEDWEAGIVAARHRLMRCEPPRAGLPAVDLARWSERHDLFHLALIDGCRKPWLRRFHRTCVEQIERYRMAILARRATRIDPGIEARLARLLAHDDHSLLAETILRRETERACALLAMHIDETAAIFTALFAEGEGAGDTGRPAPASLQRIMT